ncbi:MAG: protein arginine kinase [Planctomycetaceae bacterium]|jgi:protein arginine kinase|nr:protein arginine kinase [Planctomycetaceae bacterium]
MFTPFLHQLGPWLRGDGAVSDIVISSRIRLARNISGFPFKSKASEEDRQQIEELLHQMMPKILDENSYYELDMETLSPVDRHLLQERQLISRDIADAEGPRAAFIAKDESFSIMVNEEDHLRMQSLTSGLDLSKVWNIINQLDDKVESLIPYAFSPELGYLTACPTNVGTGLRVSVMLHLPAVTISQEIEKVFRGLQKLNLAVRGIYGEGSQALGDFYQISNQITLGRSEEELMQQVREIVDRIVQYEQKARESLMHDDKNSVYDRASRALGILQSARTMSSEEAMHLLSSVRLAVNLGILEVPAIPLINELLLYIQPAHLQRLNNSELSVPERDLARAEFLRRKLGEHP